MNNNNIDTNPVSKPSKQNKKRSKKTASIKHEPDYNEMLNLLRQKLEEAKAENKHEEAGKLRNQIWVLKDLTHGCRTNISEQDVNQILEEIQKSLSSSDLASLPNPLKKGNDEVVGSSMGAGGNRLRNLQKRLDQIAVLKEKLKKGEKLETNQIEKINSEEGLREEIQKLTDILADVTITH